MKLRNCDTSHYMENKGRMVRLAEYSRDCLKALRAETNIQYEWRQGGTLQLFRTEQQYENATRDIALLEDAGVPYQLLESSRLAEVEPALAEVAHKLTGGLQLPNDETGDCQLPIFSMKGVRVGRCNCSVPNNSMKTRPAISPCWKMLAYRISCWNPAACRKWSPRLQMWRTN